MNDKGEPVINVEKCTGCRRCLKICPSTALEIYLTPEQLKIIAEMGKEAAAVPEAEEVEEETEEVDA